MSFGKNLNKNNKYKNRIIMAAAYLIKYMNIILLSLIIKTYYIIIYIGLNPIEEIFYYCLFKRKSTLPKLIKY